MMHSGGGWSMPSNDIYIIVGLLMLTGVIALVGGSRPRPRF